MMMLHLSFNNYGGKASVIFNRRLESGIGTTCFVLGFPSPHIALRYPLHCHSAHISVIKICRKNTAKSGIKNWKIWFTN
jgi:hypothetical protein